MYFLDNLRMEHVIYQALINEVSIGVWCLIAILSVNHHQINSQSLLGIFGTGDTMDDTAKESTATG